VLHGEAAVWVDGRLSFEHLQRRLVMRATRSGPAASYVAFDLLALDGEDQRRLAYRARRAQLERLAVSWAHPL
jgi:ATP-dependent DNA ligase